MDSSPEDFNKAFDKQLDFNMALAATEVGVEALLKTLEYFTSMLFQSLAMLSDVTGRDISDLRLDLEQQLGLENTIESSIAQIRATKEVLHSINDELDGKL